MPFFLVSLSLPGSSALKGQYQHWRKHEEEDEEEEGGGHCGPDPGRGRLTTVEFNNSPLNTREEEVRFGVYEVDSWKGRGGGGGGAVVVRPLELQRNFQVGSSKHVCTGSSVIPEPPTHTFTIFNLKKQDVIVLSQLITLNKEKKKLHRHPG